MSNNPKVRVFRAFKAAVIERRMIRPGDRVVAACSGGPDSLALVRLLALLGRDLPLGVTVAHFNHMMRAAAKEDEAFVRAVCRRWRLPVVVGRRNVRLYAKRHKLNIEEAARVLRYEFLRRTARRVGAARIATGHTMNDQAETLLMHLMRGTGPAGLAGIEAVAAGKPFPVIRPLLGVARADIELFLKAEGIPFRKDESNLDCRFLRNRIRNDLLPLLERDYEPRIVEHLGRLAGLVRDEEEFVSGIVGKLAEPFILRQGKDIALDAKTLALVPHGAARRIVREFLRELKGDLRTFTFDDVEAVLALREGKEKTIKKGLTLRRERGRIARKKMAPASPGEVVWDGKGELSIQPAGLRFRGRIMAAGEQRGDFVLRGLRPDNTGRAVFDFAKLRFPLTVRSRRPGDRYRPLGAPGRKKLKEILRARGIGLSDRNSLPVFLSGARIIWAPGLPVAEEFKVRERTRSCFIIERID